jgi:hypothetical protein
MKTITNDSDKNQNNSGSTKSFDSLITELKDKDEKDKKFFRNFYIMCTILVLFYFGLLVVNPDKELTINQRISGVFYVTAFVVGTVIFRKEYMKFRSKDYSRPLLTMLKEQTEKFRFFSIRFFKILLIPVIINIGLSIAPPRYIPTDWPQMKRSLFLQIVFWSVMIIAVIIAYYGEKKKNQPLLDSINAIITDLEQ